MLPHLRDGAVEEPPGFPHGDVVGHRAGARTLAEDDDLRRVAVEGHDVLVDPAQGHPLILNAPIPRGAVGGAGAEGVGGEKAEDVDAVLDGDDHDVGEVDQAAAVQL